MRSLIAFLTALLLIFAPAAAQSDTDAPRLRNAPSDEILDTLIDLTTTYNLNPMKGDDYYLSMAVIAEFDALRINPDTNSDTLMGAFSFFGDIGWMYSVWDSSLWAQKIIARWLIEAHPDFNVQPIYMFGDITIEAMPLDFNADGTQEWGLNVTTESGQYRQFLVATGEMENLSLIETPLPWFSDGYTYWMAESGWMESERFQDLTGDNHPEWILKQNLLGGFQSWGNLHILQWRGDGLVNIAPIYYSVPHGSSNSGLRVFPPSISFDYTDLNGDGTTEISLHQQRLDNWGCASEWITVYTWHPAAARFVQQGAQTVIFDDDSFTCALKNGHVASWEGRYADAIPYYQQFLTTAFNDPNYQPTEYGYNIVLYTRIKLALAYAIVGQSDEASHLLAETMNMVDAGNVYFGGMNEIIPELIHGAKSAYQLAQDPISLCTALYITFFTYYDDDWSANPYWGIVDYESVPGMTANAPTPNPANAGCNAPALIAESPDSPDAQTVAETLRQADERYAYQRLLGRVRDFTWSMSNLSTSSVTESESEHPAYLGSTQSTLKQRLDLTHADLEKFADDPTYGAVVRYQYAWALDDAGFFDDSDVAAAYQSVIDFAPDSPWARLAALHVE